MTPEETNRWFKYLVDAMPFAPKIGDGWFIPDPWCVDRSVAIYFDHLYCQELGIQYP